MLTVITPSATYDLTVLATVKERLGLTDTSNDTLLNHLISAASGKAATYCNRVFAKEQVSETFRLPRFHHHTHIAGVSRPPLLELKRYPIVTVDAVTEGATTLTSADYEFEAETGLIYRLDGNDTRWHWTGPKIVIEYTAGFALLDGLPYQLEEAVIELVKVAWFGRKRDPMLRNESQPGLGDQQFWIGTSPGQTGALPPAIAGLLDPFRVVPV